MTPKSVVIHRSKFWPFLLAALVLLLTILLLRAEGRMFLCECGQFQIWIGDTCSPRNSQQLFDPYSLTHVLHGFLLFWLIALVVRRLTPPWQFWLALTLEAAWEVFENTSFVIQRYRAETAALGYQGDTIVNSFGDLICALVGFLIARRLGLRGSLILFVALEVILVFWIRDSLVMQILMLFRPVNAIKLWQLCQ